MPIQPEHQATRWVPKWVEAASHGELRNTMSKVRRSDKASLYDGRA